MTYEEKLLEKERILDSMKPLKDALSILEREMTDLKRGCNHPKRLWIDHGHYYHENGTLIHPRECKLCNYWLHLTSEGLKQWEDEDGE